MRRADKLFLLWGNNNNKVRMWAVGGLREKHWYSLKHTEEKKKKAIRLKSSKAKTLKTLEHFEN